MPSARQAIICTGGTADGTPVARLIRHDRCAGTLTGLWFGRLHVLRILLQHLAEACHVEADIAQQVEDVQSHRPQAPEC